MTSALNLCIGLLIGTLAISCEKSEDVDLVDRNESLVFGRFFGFCQGEKCIEIYRLQNEELAEDQNDYYVRSDTFYSGDFQLLGMEKYKEVKDLREAIPSQLYQEDQIRFGCPDCADQGGIYLEIKSDNFHEFWILDQDKEQIPAYLHEFMDLVNQKIDFLSNQ